MEIRSEGGRNLIDQVGGTQGVQPFLSTPDGGFKTLWNYLLHSTVALEGDVTEKRRALFAEKVRTPEMLLSYQLLAQRFNLQVELVSKVAEAATQVVKKLQVGG